MNTGLPLNSVMRRARNGLVVIAASHMRNVVPMRLFDLVDAVVPPAEVHEALVELLRAKRTASEAAEAQRLPVLDRWIEQSLEALEARAPDSVAPANRAPLEQFFRSAIGA